MKKKGVPKALWLLFQDRVRSLADTLTSLLPPPHSSSSAACRFCKGRRCLCCCSGPNAMSFLLRPSDPSDYRTLLNRCLVVVSEHAPPLSRFSPDSHWSQIQIVRAVIETTLLEQSMPPNAISSGYNKCDKSSTVVELLTSSAWCLLLDRVGDGIMVYLLKNTLIFLQIANKQHQQVTGLPIADLCRKVFKREQSSQCCRLRAPFDVRNSLKSGSASSESAVSSF